MTLPLSVCVKTQVLFVTRKPEALLRPGRAGNTRHLPIGMKAQVAHWADQSENPPLCSVPGDKGPWAGQTARWPVRMGQLLRLGRSEPGNPSKWPGGVVSAVRGEVSGASPTCPRRSPKIASTFLLVDEPVARASCGSHDTITSALRTIFNWFMYFFYEEDINFCFRLSYRKVLQSCSAQQH